MKKLLGSAPNVNPVDRREQFERLVRQIEPVMMRVAMRMTGGNMDRASDVVQEAIVNGYRAFMKGSLNDISGFKPWMLRILTNEVYSTTAKEAKAVPTDKIDEMVEATQDKGTNFEKELMDQILDPALDLALKALNPDQRMLVTLIDIEELDYAEAAEVLNIPMGTVRSRLARARMQLSQLLTQNPIRDF